MRGSHPRDPGSNPGRSILKKYYCYFLFLLEEGDNIVFKKVK